MTTPSTGAETQPKKRSMISDGSLKESLGIPYNIAVVDSGGHLLAFSRQDGALTLSVRNKITSAPRCPGMIIEEAEDTSVADPSVRQRHVRQLAIFETG